jgi:hypothetical protein
MIVEKLNVFGYNLAWYEPIRPSFIVRFPITDFFNLLIQLKLAETKRCSN